MSLAAWLRWITDIQPQEMVLGLDRVKAVAARLGFSAPACPVILVAGTNGKGSCVATLEKIYQEQGYKTGVFTSPILYRHNEMLRIEGKEAEDPFFLEAYDKIEQVRNELLLTPFEYHTLACIDILRQQPLDVWIMEVGLGGRLDAVNILDADLALVTTIDFDHMEWLGNTRELIAREKAGIFRQHRPAVCGDYYPPSTLLDYAEELAAPLYCQGKDFYFSLNEQSWNFQGKNSVYRNLPLSQLALQNLATSLMAIELLQTKLPVAPGSIYQGIKTVTLPGRIEILKGPITVIFDVAHNPAAISFLAEQVQKLPCPGKKRAVFSMLADKDLAGSLQAIKQQIDEWYVAPLKAKRAAPAACLRAVFQEEEITNVSFYPSIEKAQAAAWNTATENDFLLVFGSFHTVAEARMLK